jgi:hypothetical protein
VASPTPLQGTTYGTSTAHGRGLTTSGYTRVNSGQASSCHSEPKGWGPLRLCHITLCILLRTRTDSDSFCRSHYMADLITMNICLQAFAAAIVQPGGSHVHYHEWCQPCDMVSQAATGGQRSSQCLQKCHIVPDASTKPCTDTLQHEVVVGVVFGGGGSLWACCTGCQQGTNLLIIC